MQLFYRYPYVRLRQYLTLVRYVTETNEQSRAGIIIGAFLELTVQIYLSHRRRELHDTLKEETPFINITFQGENDESKIFLPYEQAKILADSIFNILENLSVSNQTTKVDETQNQKMRVETT